MNLPPPPDNRYAEPEKSRTTFYIIIACASVLALCCIGAVGIGLLFPAILKVRESANRAKSQNNMRQIGLAIHSYAEGNKDTFPYICDFGPGAPTGFGVESLHYRILPYVDQIGGIQIIYQANAPTTYYGTPNGMVGNTRRVFLDPAEIGPDGDPRIEIVSVAAPGAKDPFEAKFTGYYPTTNYVANGMVFSPQPDGQPPSIKTIVDGTSETIMLGQRYQICKGANGDVPTLWGLGAYSAATASFALPTPQGEYPKTTTPELVLNQIVPAMPTVKGGNLPVGFQHMPKPGACNPRIMQSLHPSGMAVCMFDGSVRMIAPSISAATFWASVTPAGNEELGADW